jgi:hypothetical protein
VTKINAIKQEKNVGVEEMAPVPLAETAAQSSALLYKKKKVFLINYYFFFKKNNFL